jgi:glycosyltransferase involved in cell wall biosynthesis
VASTKVTVVYPGYDAERFRPASSGAIAAIRARYGLPADYVLFVGTIQPRKNIDRLLEAMARLEQPVPLVVAGRRGWLFEPILRRGEELDLRDRVMFLDYVAADDLPALMSGARCFVLPALHEGFGFPVVEAMACGTPVVCSNTTSLMEVAGDAALLIDPLDVAALAEAIARVLRDDELRAKMRQKGLARTQRFSWDRCARETMTVLERVGRT